MVDIGERIEVELGAAEADKRRALTLVRELPGVSECGLVGDTLKIRCSRNANRLVAVLDALRGEGIGYGRVFSEPPTLNDVFLEITGKELRD
jgi:ABC-2 type transport system ATP-binding protein